MENEKNKTAEQILSKNIDEWDNKFSYTPKCNFSTGMKEMLVRSHEEYASQYKLQVQDLDKENTRLCNLWAKQEIKIEDLEKEITEQKRHKGYLEDINENLTRELNRYRLSTPNKEEWRSVEDGLPTGFWGDPIQEYYQKFSEQVNILVDTGVVGTGAYNRETKKWFVGDLSKERYQELTNTTATHWQPLPKGLVTQPNP